MRQILETCIDITSEAWQELKRARLRTYLAILGIVIGAIGFTVLICTLHLENALRGTQDNNEIQIGMPTLEDYNRTVFRRKSQLKRYKFIPADGEAIAKECPYVEQVVIHGMLPADLKGKNWYKDGVESTNITRPDLFPWIVIWGYQPRKLIWGRVFTPAEMESGARVVVIDQRMSGELWGQQYGISGNGQPGSRYLHINGVRFEVIGVLQSKAGPGGGRTAIIPYTCMQELFWDASWAIGAVAKPGFRKAAAKQIDEVLFKRIGDPGYSYVSLPGISYEELKVYTFFGVVGVLILFSAGIAVSNKAYIDALERVQQFAVRRALGATKLRIYAIVLMESALICGFGCFYGGIIGWMIFASFSAWKWIERDLWDAIPAASLGAMFLFVIALGVVGGLQGAAIAAKANPAEVLARKEIV